MQPQSIPSPSLSPSIGLLLNPLLNKSSKSTSSNGYISPEYNLDYFNNTNEIVEENNLNNNNNNNLVVVEKEKEEFRHLAGVDKTFSEGGINGNGLKRGREVEMLPPSQRRINSYSFDGGSSSKSRSDSYEDSPLDPNSIIVEERTSSEPTNGFKKSILPPPRFTPSTLSRIEQPASPSLAILSSTPTIKPPKPRIKKDSISSSSGSVSELPTPKVSPSFIDSKSITPPPPPPPPPPAPPVQSTSSSSSSEQQQRQHSTKSRERESRESISKNNNNLEPSIFGVEPIDEFTKEVGDWLWTFCSTLDPAFVEIEAKIGILIDKRGGGRFMLPVAVETIVTDDSNLRFESKMTDRQHKHYNQLLNSRVEASASPSYTLTPIRYSHSREIDSFHSIQNGNRKIRITKDQKNGKIINVVEKLRMADMSVFSPKRVFDFRISVNLEQPATEPTSQPSYTRQKDRISYSHQLFQIDLTQVKQQDSSSSNPPTHELEIEFKDSKHLLREGNKEARGEENQYFEMIGIFLNNIRMLIRNAS